MILNDPELSSTLRYRSNVDLKDKWRNMNVIVTSSSTRDRGRTSTRRTRAAPKNNDQLLAMSTITSEVDDEIVDVKPIVSMSVEGWNTSNSKKSHSRLDNIIMEAIKNLNEPTGSHRTTIANYIEEQYWPPSDFDHLLSAKLKYLATSGKLLKVNRKYRIAPSLLEDVQREPLKLGSDASRTLTRSQVDAELVRMATMTVEAAAAAAAHAVAEAEAIMAEAEAAAREAEAAEAEARAAQAFAEAAVLTLKNRNAAKLV
ncbi:single myb histone 5 isoform X2 [Zea mays]|nr:single myb histone 5 isoform X2 [Zea mays]|eukprot:XP_008673422.1 single myb histone 5 isoform X2 [Zea mays]